MVRCLAVAAGLLCAAMSFARPAQAAEGNIGTNDASLYYVKHPGQTVVLYFPGQWSASSSSSQNPKLGTFQTQFTLEAKSIEPIVVKGTSARVDYLEINGKEYHLPSGALFRVSAKGEIVQLPFAPLEPTREYLLKLKGYFEGG